MNSDGHIKEFKDDAEAKRQGYDTPISKADYGWLMQLPEADRPMELMLRDWLITRERLGRKPTLHDKIAFKAGWKARRVFTGGRS